MPILIASPGRSYDHTMRDAFDRMNDQELEAYAREGKLPWWFPRQANANEGVQ
jgi:hypothetical protein